MVMIRTIRVLAVMAALAVVCEASATAALDLMPLQRARMREMSQTTRRRTSDIRGNIADRRTQLRDLYGQYKLDLNRAHSLNRDINQQQLFLLNANLDSQSAIRAILGSDQFAGFTGLMHRPVGRRRPDDEAHGDVQMRFGGREADLLGLTDIQRANLKRLRQKDDQRPLPSVGTIRAKREELEALYEGYNLDIVKARAIIRDLNAAQMQLLDARLQFQIELRQALTEDQFNRLREMIAEREKQHQMKKRTQHPGQEPHPR